ncbi:MAG: hypothetical protein ACO4AI_06790, partial [Prochlorothrix sp.]
MDPSPHLSPSPLGQPAASDQWAAEGPGYAVIPNLCLSQCSLSAAKKALLFLGHLDESEFLGDSPRKHQGLGWAA